MVRFTSLVRSATSAALSLALAACVGIGGLSPPKSYTTNTTFQLPHRAPDFIPAASEVGKSLGYRVSGTDTDRNAVTLTDSVDGMGAALTGRHVQRTVVVALRPDGRTVAINLALNGNLGTASQKSAEQRLEALKAALTARFR